MLRFFRRLRKDENGATAIEYGLIAGLISVIIISAVTLVGTQLRNVFNHVGTTLQGVTTSGSTSG